MGVLRDLYGGIGPLSAGPGWTFERRNWSHSGRSRGIVRMARIVALRS
jgi:hypothetical protein